MDLLFSRYASPFCYIDALLEYGEFAQGIGNIMDTVQEERMWNFYLSNNPMNKNSYDDWKKELHKQTEINKPMSKAQVDATFMKSQEILKNFKPPKK